MKTNFITAQEANKKAKDFSALSDICSSISCAAERGQYKSRFVFIPDKDITKLEVLGYTVTKDSEEKLPYTVSWE